MKLSPKLKIGAKLVLLIIFLVILNLTPVSKRVKNFFYFISSPIQKSFWRAGDKVSDFFETVANIKNLKKENEELKLKIQELLAKNAKIPELEKENKDLREALEIGLEKEFKLILAQVIGKDISQDSILIDKGLKDGVTNNLPVITQQKSLVGKIGEVYENFSKVILISNKGSAFNAQISRVDEAAAVSSPTELLRSKSEGKEESAALFVPANARVGEEGLAEDISGLVKGKGNFQLFLDLVPKEKEIKEGDLIITSSLGGVFPKGLLVGQIQKIKKSDIEPFQQAEIKPAFEIKELEAVFIIK